ncbi:hypothetical protein [Adhaeribacter aquaticus]|uniref:hypothetical protein n=1 Tax=Adhaeribacter aquaticus TaxID=299567 RepID=UPI0003FFA1B0|nr:hypothetical protein [Adhaeribacter aquaticus]
MEALTLAPAIEKEYSFNKNHVCINADVAFSQKIDFNNFLEITFAQHPKNKRWCIGYDFGSNQECSFYGSSSGASHNPAELGTGIITLEDGLQKFVNRLLDSPEAFPLHPKILEALKAYAVTLNIVIPGQQLPLF